VTGGRCVIRATADRRDRRSTARHARPRFTARGRAADDSRPRKWCRRCVETCRALGWTEMSLAAPAQVVELQIESIAAGGHGVGRSEGLVVFTPRTAPGDVARVRIESIRRFARGRLESLIVASPDRVEPPWPHYTVHRCGGCQVQHLRYGAQLAAKRRIVRDALERIARRPFDVGDTRPSAREWRYRGKLTLAMRRDGGEWTMGLHPYDDAV